MFVFLKRCILKGRYGFNSYNLMTSMILGFNAVSNLYANVNNNNQVYDDLYNPRLQRRLQPLLQREQQ
jgi:hypothetical protein